MGKYYNKNNNYDKFNKKDMLIDSKQSMYSTFLLLLTVSRFKWNNIPTEIPANVIEKQLLLHNLIVMFQDRASGKFKILPCTYANDTMDDYGRPLKVIAYGRNSAKYEVNIIYDDMPTTGQFVGVVCHENAMNISLLPFIYHTATDLSNTHMTRATNISQQRIPIMMSAPEQRVNDMYNIYNAINEHQPVIFGYKNKGLDEMIDIKPIDSKVQFIGEELSLVKQHQLNDILVLLGITTNTSLKKERLVSDEATQNTGYEIIINSYLNPRQHFVEQINKYFKLNVTVEYAENDSINDSDESEENDE